MSPPAFGSGGSRTPTGSPASAGRSTSARRVSSPVARWRSSIRWRHPRTTRRCGRGSTPARRRSSSTRGRDHVSTRTSSTRLVWRWPPCRRRTWRCRGGPRDEHLDVDLLGRVAQHLPVAGAHDDRVRVTRLGHELRDADLVQRRQPRQPADGDVASARLDQREQRAGDPGRLRDLGEREPARGSDRSKRRPERSLVHGGCSDLRVQLRRIDTGTIVRSGTAIDRDCPGCWRFV